MHEWNENGKHAQGGISEISDRVTPNSENRVKSKKTKDGKLYVFLRSHLSERRYQNAVHQDERWSHEFHQRVYRCF
jgi:hypothetical protein